MKKENQKKEIEEKLPDILNEIPDFNNYVENLEDLRKFLEINKLNPIEKMMAVNLLLHDYGFTPQCKIDLPEGWEINGRKYFVADFLINNFSIIIETDGKIHLNEENQIKDRNKDNVLTSLGYRVFRFNWDETMKSNENYDIFILIDKLVESLITKNLKSTK